MISNQSIGVIRAVQRAGGLTGFPPTNKSNCVPYSAQSSYRYLYQESKSCYVFVLTEILQSEQTV